MNVLKKIVLTALSIGALYFCAGYLTAWQAKQACVDESYRSAQQRDVHGYRMGGGKVRPTRGEFEANIAGPFQVEVVYSVPRDMHATIFVERYLTLPWRREFRSSEVIQLVDAPDHRLGESALAAAPHGQAARTDET
ncbi:hypothetical protein [Pseudomonas sp. CGJS7]|uniref:hypothetical protein n=1 Tax=Pseudomonas sp. CGJS7 TaxID=3109348 RepID=UPI00300BDA36